MRAIVAIVSGRVFLGAELCHEEEYIHAAIHFTIEVFTAVDKLRKWRWWLRPVGQYFVPEFKKIAEHRRKAHNRPYFLAFYMELAKRLIGWFDRSYVPDSSSVGRTRLRARWRLL